MARDINDVVVSGYGSWSDVNALPTLGFGTGSTTSTGEGRSIGVLVIAAQIGALVIESPQNILIKETGAEGVSLP